MRRLAFSIALAVVCSATMSWAAPFDQLSSRLKQYDDGASQTAQPADSKATLGSQPSSIDESRGPASSGTWQDDWSHDGPWDEPCYGACCDNFCGDPCGIGCGVYTNAEYLYWWVRGGATPPLVTSSPQGTPQDTAGILPQASVLFGGDRLNQSGRSGGRFSIGWWFDPYQTAAIESSTLFLGSNTEKFVATSDGTPILARPFYNVQTNQNDANLIAFPNLVIGSVDVYSTSRVVGTELNVRHLLCVDCGYRLDFLAGVRFLQLSEALSIATNSTAINQETSAPVGTNFGILDQFVTKNDFWGGQIGLNSKHTNGCWTLDLLAKVAIGGVTQIATINGTTVVTEPNSTPVTQAGGILALASNSGRHQRSRFAVLPEFGASLHYQINGLWRANVGYTFLLLTNVLRPGDQIDARLDPDQFPPPISGPHTYPKFIYNDSDVWLQGINVGLEATF